MAVVSSLSVLLGINSREFDRGILNSQRKVGRFTRESQRSFNSIARVAATAFAAVGSTQALRGITRASDTLTNVTNQLRAAGIPAEQLANSQRDIARLAQETRSSLEATGGLYARILRSSRDLGVSQQQALTIARAFQQSLQLSGAETSEAQAAALQFGQALASGRLQGDELRSILENNSVFAQSIARELGVGVGQLREMGAAGELSSELLADLAQRVAPELNRQFLQLNPTFAQLGQIISNDITIGLDQIARAGSGGASALSQVAVSIGETFRSVSEEIARILVVIQNNMGAVNDILRATAAIIAVRLIPAVTTLATRTLGTLTRALLFLLSPIGSVIAAIAALGVIGVLAWEPIQETASAVWDRIRIGASIMSTRVELLFTNLKNGVVDIFNGIANGVIESINFAIRQLNRASNALGQGNVADELGLFGGGAGSNDRIAELQQQLKDLRAEAEAANMAVSAGIGDIGGVLGDSIERVQTLIDELIGGGQAPAAFDSGDDSTPTPDDSGEGSGGRNTPNASLVRFQERFSQQLSQVLLRGDFSNVGDSLLNTLQSSLASAAQEPLQEIIDGFVGSILDTFKSAFGEGGGGFGSLLGGLFGGFLASGGPVTPGKGYIVGERGPEFFQPRTSGDIIPNNQLGGQNNITINYEVRGDNSAEIMSVLRNSSDTIADLTQQRFRERGVLQ